MAFSYDFEFFELKNSQTFGTTTSLAFANWIIDGVVKVEGFKVMDTNGDLWVSFPTKEGTKLDENGKKQYFKTVRFIDDKTNESDTRTPAEEEFVAALLESYAASKRPSRAQTAAVQARAKPPAPKNARDAAKAGPLY